MTRKKASEFCRQNVLPVNEFRLKFGLSCVKAWECTPGKEVIWNLLTLFTTSGTLFLEVSLVAFLFQGNYASGAEALTRTFLISGLVIGLDFLLKVPFCS